MVHITIPHTLESVAEAEDQRVAAGCPVPASHQGRDLSAVLRSEEHDTGREDCLAVLGSQQLMLRSERWKYLRYPGGSEILYDLATDPDETTDVSGEAVNQAVLQQQRERLLERVLAASDPGTPQRCRF